MSMLDLLADTQAVFCACVGMAPWQQLEEVGITPVVDYAWQPIRDALQNWWLARPKQSTTIRKGVA